MQIEHETVQGEYSTLNGPDMIPFWKGYRDWFDSFGISLYELRFPHPRAPIEHWFPPPMTALGRPPFAIRLGSGTQLIGRAVKVQLPISSFSIPLTVLKPKLGLGQDVEGHDVFIKITDKGSEEHRINQYLLQLNGSLKPEDCPYALRPVAVLDSPYNFSFIVMPW